VIISPDFFIAGSGDSLMVLEIKKRLQDEIQTLETELRVHLPKEILKAREHGDLRENAEYKAAKERQSFLEARTAQLHRRMAALNMVNLDRIPRDKVGLGSSVHVVQEDTGEKKVFEIVVPEEADPTVGRISPSSPIGKCLLGQEEGDSVEVKVPSGTREYEIIKLVTVHDQVKSDE
jgi:transcription elongation factor GreA